MKMLIIDDSKAMRGFLKNLATEMEFTTEEAEDGKAGLNKLVQNDPREPYDVALVDWDMPVMTGIELIRLVRRNRSFDSVKLMMVTSQNSEEKITEALEAGADDFMMKPVTREAFEEKLTILGLKN